MTISDRLTRLERTITEISNSGGLSRAEIEASIDRFCIELAEMVDSGNVMFVPPDKAEANYRQMLSASPPWLARTFANASPMDFRL